MKQKRICGIDNIDIGILKILLDDHIKSGEYWGVQKHHYKRCVDLVVKLDELSGVGE